MKRFYLAIHVVLWSLTVSPALLCAAPPNVVLSQALHFSAPDGTSIAIGPGKYLIEQAGSSELRLIPEGDKPSVTIQAQSLTHEQYELFSPMALTRPQKEDGFLIELLLPGGIRLESRGSTKAPAEPTKIAASPTAPPQIPIIQEPGNAPSTETPVFAPPQPAPEANAAPLQPHTNLSSLESSLLYHPPSLPSEGTRMIIDEQEPGKESLYLAVLAPDHIGLTMFEQPGLFWFIAQPSSQPVDILITDEGSTQILLDVRMLPPIRPGVHKVELKDYGIRLQPDTIYQWKIILQGNTPGESYTTSGWIMRVPPPENVTTIAHPPTINSMPPKHLLDASLWYDAIWALSERIQSQPTDSTALTQRAALFEQVGLLPPARQDRAHLPTP